MGIQKAKETNTLLASVHLGNIVAHILGFGFSGDNLIPQPNPIIWDALKLRRGTILSLKDKFIDDYSHTIKMMLM